MGGGDNNTGRDVQTTISNPMQLPVVQPSQSSQLPNFPSFPAFLVFLPIPEPHGPVRHAPSRIRTKTRDVRCVHVVTNVAADTTAALRPNCSPLQHECTTADASSHSRQENATGRRWRWPESQFYDQTVNFRDEKVLNRLWSSSTAFQGGTDRSTISTDRSTSRWSHTIGFHRYAQPLMFWGSTNRSVAEENINAYKHQQSDATSAGSRTTWACQACTFANPNKNKRCGACERKRPADASCAAASQEEETDGWDGTWFPTASRETEIPPFSPKQG